MVRGLTDAQKAGFKDNPVIPPAVNLVRESLGYIHNITLSKHKLSPTFDLFFFIPKYETYQERYDLVRKEYLDLEEDGEIGSAFCADKATDIMKFGEKLNALFQSNNTIEECTVELLELRLCPEDKTILCQDIVNSCAEKRTFEIFYPSLSHQLCFMDKKYRVPFEKAFRHQYEGGEGVNNLKSLNLAKFFVHLLLKDSISWDILRGYRLCEQSPSHAHIKFFFIELTKALS